MSRRVRRLSIVTALALAAPTLVAAHGSDPRARVWWAVHCLVREKGHACGQGVGFYPDCSHCQAVLSAKEVSKGAARVRPSLLVPYLDDQRLSYERYFLGSRSERGNGPVCVVVAEALLCEYGDDELTWWDLFGVVARADGLVIRSGAERRWDRYVSRWKLAAGGSAELPHRSRSTSRDDGSFPTTWSTDDPPRPPPSWRF